MTVANGDDHQSFLFSLLLILLKPISGIMKLILLTQDITSISLPTFIPKE